MILFACATLAFLPYAFAPEAEGVSSRGVLAWVDACERELDALHGFVLLRHGKVIAEGSWSPYDTLNETHRLYSHSKAFTSTAVGFLVDDGKLDLDERVVDVLADKAPDALSENLKALRVRDLLTMNVGASRTDAERDDADGDWERAFLANDFDGKPGQAFRYDSGATYLLASIVERRSGVSLMELLRERLFDRVGITKAWTTTSPSGTPCGGWGMNMTTRELALFGQFYLDRGAWKDKRLLSEEWISLATARQTWSGRIGITGQDGSDWHQGYGFQFWCCRHGAYRADGANGQFTIVMPEQDAVLSLHAGECRTQHELDLVWKHLLPAFSDRPLPDDETAARMLRERCAKLALPPVSGGEMTDGSFCGVAYVLTNAVCGIKALRLDCQGPDVVLSLETAAGSYQLPVGQAQWRKGLLRFSDRRHESLGDIIGDQRVAASTAMADTDELNVRVLLLDGPQKIDMKFRRIGNESIVTGVVHGIGGGDFLAKQSDKKGRDK